MDHSRRSFFRNVFLGGASSILGLEASTDIPKLRLPIVNPSSTSELGIDDIYKDMEMLSHREQHFIYSNDNIKIFIHDDRWYLTPKKPMGMQMLYSATKQLWHNDPKMIRYPFPFVAITPEMYEVVDNWQMGVEFIRGAGVKVHKNKTPYSEEGLYFGISVLSQEGMVYDSNMIELPNSGLLRITKEGNTTGFYRKYTDDKLIPLQDHLEQTINISHLDYQFYRIP